MFRATNLHELQVIKADGGEICFVLLMEEIRRPPVEVGSFSHYLHGFIHRRWLTWFLPSTVSPGQMCENKLMEGAISPVPFAVRKGCVLFFFTFLVTGAHARLFTSWCRAVNTITLPFLSQKKN